MAQKFSRTHRMAGQQGPTAVAVQWKSAIYAALAFVAVVLLGFSIVSAPQARAYIPVDLDAAAVGDASELSASITHSPDTADLGQQVTYTGDFSAKNTGNSPMTVTLSISQSVKAPFDGGLTSSDLNVSGGTIVGSPVKTADNTWAYTITVPAGSTMTARMTKTATVNADAKPGSLILASATMNSKPSTMDIKPIAGASEVIPGPGGVCSGTAVFRGGLQQDSNGAWLADIKFAIDPSKVTLDPLPDAATLMNGTESDPFSVKFTNVPAEWVEKLKAGAVVKNNDGSAPLYATDPLITNNSLNWLDSINWNYDPKVWSGTDSWLPADAQIEIRRPYTYRACAGDVALDNNPSRLNSMAVQLTMGRASLETDTATTDAFILPGGTAPKPDAWCEDIYYTDYAGGGKGISTSIGKIHTPDLVAENNIGRITSDFGGIAISKMQPNYIYYMRGFDLYRYNLTTAQEEKVGKYIGPYAPSATAMSFDSEGRLWIANGGRMRYWEFDGTTIQNGGNSMDGARYDMNSIIRNSSNPNDIAFLGDGSLVLAASHTRNGTGVYYFDNALARDSNATLSASNGTEWGKYPANRLLIRAIGFGQDGKLYVSYATSTGTTRDLVVLEEGGNRVPVYPTPGPTRGYVDLGSCSFGKPVPEEGGFQVSKAPVDPVTGEVLEPGAASTNKVKIAADGTAKISYSIVVANLGNEAKDPGVITDTFTAPDAFEVQSMAASSGSQPVDGFSKDNRTLNPGVMPAGSVKSYIVTVTVKAKSIADAAAANGECDAMGDGSSAGGFFNKVDMAEDKDGSENNEACIPFENPKTAHIKLIKKILDEDSVEVTDPAKLAQFNLIAAGYDTATGAPLSAAEGDAGADGVAVDQDVVPGRYVLGENFTLDAGVNTNGERYFQAKSWECSGAQLNESGKEIVLPEGGDATCRIVNIVVTPRSHIEKLAGSPVEASGEHIGSAVELSREGTGELVFRVRVSNDSMYTGDTGVIRDQFVLPEGLLSNGPVKVEFTTAEGNATREGGKDKYAYEEFAGEGAVLADSVKNLGPTGTESGVAEFVVTIPVKEDTTPTDNGSTKFKEAKENLAECAQAESLGDNTVAGSDRSKGVTNEVTLENEFPNYATPEDVVSRDNIACIPVTKQDIPPKWQVKKEAASPEAGSATVGQKVVMSEVDQPEAGYQAVATYTVTATNVGEEASPMPAITDAPKLPEGFVVTGIRYGKVGEELVAVSPITSEFTIPASAADVPAGESVQFTVEVTGFVSLENAKSMKWETTVGDTGNDVQPGVGECVGTDGKLTPGTGFYNKVTIGDDQDGEDNNDSCVPVVPPATRVLVEKRDASGKQLLAGAEFTLFEAVKADGAVEFSKGAVVAAPLEALTEQTRGELAAGSLAEGDDDLTGRFVTPRLNAGQYYWIQETKSPAADENMPGYSLLPEPVLFRVGSGGVVVPVNKLGDPIENPCSDNAEDKCVNLDDSFYFTAGRIDVHDPRMGELPKAGGVGHWSLAGGAGLLIAVSLFGLFRMGGRRRNA